MDEGCHRRQGLLAAACLIMMVGVAYALDGTLKLVLQHRGEPIAGATVVVNGESHVTGEDGSLTLRSGPGVLEVALAAEGYLPVSASIELADGEEKVMGIELEPLPAMEEAVTVIASTRTERGIEEQPMRVEVLGREEIEEKMMMTPGDVVMMLNEMGGMRVSTTSPSLGAASVRIQGMKGRYTRFLSDGLPLYGEQPGGLALLQIPPMDLGRVEVIKGTASALYGGGAMGGVVNLISRRPGETAEREILVNRSSRGATDAVLWLSRPIGPAWSVTFLGSGHGQRRDDVDGDGWADLAGYGRGVARPRLFWDGGGGRSFFATAGITYEDRTGGTMPESVLEATGEPYEESLETHRFDFGSMAQTIVGGRFVLTARAAFASARHDHLFGEVRERDRHETAFFEIALRGISGAHTWVAGTALERDSYHPDDVPRFRYAFTTPGLFVQDEFDLFDWLSISASARLDGHSEYGTFVSPRVSALLRRGGWTARLSAGTGFFGPTPLTEETEAAGLTRLNIIETLSAERGRSVSLDVGRTDGPVSYNVTLFSSRIEDPIFVERTSEYVLRNLAGPTTHRGIELLGTLRHRPLAVTGTYTYVRSEETDGNVSAEVALTPRHSAGVVGMIESEQKGRIGVELYFTGRQRVEANPYRETTEPYVILGILAERRFGSIRLFVNGENLTGVRQTEWDPLLRPTRNVDGRWTVDAWAPLEGMVVNGGVRVDF